MITLALLGDVHAAGMTPMELSDLITERLRKYIQDPVVTVSVVAANSQKVYVLGEVQKVGPVEMSASMTPLQAISAAGGVTPYAKEKSAYILRGPAGHQKKIPFNYKKALKGDPNSSLVLQAGDTIVVP
jgi:polysaccharide export outer membrane protein